MLARSSSVSYYWRDLHEATRLPFYFLDIFSLFLFSFSRVSLRPSLSRPAAALPAATQSTRGYTRQSLQLKLNENNLRKFSISAVNPKSRDKKITGRQFPFTWVWLFCLPLQDRVPLWFLLEVRRGRKVRKARTQNLPSVLCTTTLAASHQQNRNSPVQSAAKALGLLTINPLDQAPAAATASEQRADRATMNILAPPPPSSVSLTPFGRRQDLGRSLTNHPSPFNRSRSELYSYPSPPMSDSHSPNRRSAQLVKPESSSYPSSSDARRPLPPPPPVPPPLPPIEPRTATSAQPFVHPGTVYSGEGQPYLYQPSRVAGAHSYHFGYTDRGIPPFPGTQGSAPQAQPTAIIAPQAARATKAARRTKAHVASACVNCKKAHLSCDVRRPCGRCEAAGKQETCKDVQHKKRGRPRLRDDKEFSNVQRDSNDPALSQTPGRSGPERAGSLAGQSQFPSSHSGSDSLRTLRRVSRESGGPPRIHQQSPQHINRGPLPKGVHSSAYGAFPYTIAPDPEPKAYPIAFLDWDLIILKCNQLFQDLVSFQGDIRGKYLKELLNDRGAGVCQQLQQDLSEEKYRRDPSYMAPLITSSRQHPVHSLAETDVDQVSEGFDDYFQDLPFSFRQNGAPETIRGRFRLAKWQSVYFVTLVLTTEGRSVSDWNARFDPSLSALQFPPPTSYASQSLSASASVPSHDYPVYARPPSSASSAPITPYYSYPAHHNSISQGPTSAGGYGNNTSFGYSPSTRNDHSYFSTLQPHSQPQTYPSPYPPLARRESATSNPARRPESSRESNAPPRIERFHLPPIRTQQTMGEQGQQGYGLNERGNDRVRRRESSPHGAVEPETPDTGKRRRLNIHEVLTRE